MKNKILKVHPQDNVIVALTNLVAGETVQLGTETYVVLEDVSAKHKFATEDLQIGDEVTMYGVLVGKAQTPIFRGGLISTANLKHAAGTYQLGEQRSNWPAPQTGTLHLC